MSFIMSTIKCPCGKYANIALGTFGYGIPTNCNFCFRKNVDFENAGSGWHADQYGNWKEETVHGDSLKEPSTVEK